MSIALDSRSSISLELSPPDSSIANSIANSIEGGARVTSKGAFLDALEKAVAQFRNRTALRIFTGESWTELTYGALYDDARRVASWLMENGVGRGATIALVAESRPEWPVALLAVMMSGAKLVPIDSKLTHEEIAALLEHAAPQLVLTSRASEALARAASANSRSVCGVITIDGGADVATREAVSFAAVSFASMRPSCTRNPRHRANDETALVVYTSGTTGNAKGVETTFGNLLYQMLAMHRAIGPMGDERFLSVLPLNHLYELICGLLTPMNRGAAICYSESLLPDDIARLMREERITSLVGVPLLFRALKRGIERTIRQRGLRVQKWFARAMSAARFIPSYAARRALFGSLLRRFGPDLRVFYSGGAALDSDVATFFDRIGLPIYQGYGLSETSPVIATNTPRANRLGSVGKALDGVEVRIVKKNPGDVEGEIQTRGPHVMRGYLYRPDLTDAVIDSDGWFKTGDLGKIDADGFLFVTGRSKDLIVLGGGKKVHPDEVEDVLVRSALFKEACVVGAPSLNAISRGFDEVCAVIVPDDAFAATFTERDALEAAIRAEIMLVCESLAAFKRPTRLLVRDEALPKTATRKLKRPLVLEWIRNECGVERTKR